MYGFVPVCPVPKCNLPIAWPDFSGGFLLFLGSRLKSVVGPKKQAPSVLVTVLSHLLVGGGPPGRGAIPHSLQPKQPNRGDGGGTPCTCRRRQRRQRLLKINLRFPPAGFVRMGSCVPNARGSHSSGDAKREKSKVDFSWSF